MKFLILGGGGFMGSALAIRLLRDGHAIRIFEHPRVAPIPEIKNSKEAEWVAGDFLSVHEVSEALAGVDIVFHFISTTLPKNSNDDPVYDVQSNLVGTLQLLNEMVRQGNRKIVFASSGGTVYGIPRYLPIDEKHPTEPLVSYGITKLAIEKYLRLYEMQHGVNAITLRVANPYGMRQRLDTAQGAIGVFLHRALTETPIEIWGDGSVTRDYIYIDDVVEAFVKSVEYSGPERVFNISSGVGTNLNELVQMLEEILGRKIEYRYLPARSFDVPASILSNHLAQQELSWSPLVPMQDGVERTAKWMKRHLNS